MINKLSVTFSLSILFLIGSPQESFAKDLQRNTYFAGGYQNYTGDRENSLAGIDGYSLTVVSTPHKNHFRLIYGATLSYIDGRGYVAGDRYSMFGYGADAIIGLSIYPVVKKIAIRPFFEMAGIGGFKYLDVSNAPDGIQSRETGLSGGYKLSIGLETNLGDKYGLRTTVDYIKNSSSMLETSNYSFDNFAFTLGFYF